MYIGECLVATVIMTETLEKKKNKRLDSFYNHGFPHIPLHSEASIHRPNGDTFGTKIDSMGNPV